MGNAFRRENSKNLPKIVLFPSSRHILTSYTNNYVFVNIRLIFFMPIQSQTESPSSDFLGYIYRHETIYNFFRPDKG